MSDIIGLELANKPLTNFEIIDAVEKLRIPRFRGVFVRNNLQYKPKKNECGILNLDDASGEGTHWVGWYRKKQQKLLF